MSKRTRSSRGSGTRRRGGSRSLRGVEMCGAPGCTARADRIVLDPTVPEACLGACDDHWPDLVALLWSLGAYVSPCLCEGCQGEGWGQVLHGV